MIFRFSVIFCSTAALSNSVTFANSGCYSSGNDVLAIHHHDTTSLKASLSHHRTLMGHLVAIATSYTPGSTLLLYNAPDCKCCKVTFTPGILFQDSKINGADSFTQSWSVASNSNLSSVTPASFNNAAAFSGS